MFDGKIIEINIRLMERLFRYLFDGKIIILLNWIKLIFVWGKNIEINICLMERLLKLIFVSWKNIGIKSVLICKQGGKNKRSQLFSVYKIIATLLNKHINFTRKNYK